MSYLKVNNLEKSYKKGFIPKSTPVLKGVSFTVPSGSITGFLGGNGAGKTTTMKCILGLSFIDGGEVEYFDSGTELTSDIKARIGFLPEHPYFYDYLTGMEFLRFYGQVSKRWKKADLIARAETLLKRVDLYHAKDRKLRDYSKGMKQKLGLAQALIHDPDLIILDEPMSGLDPDGRYYMAEIIRETAAQGKAIFFSSHLLPDAEKLCENLVVLKQGVVTFEGKMGVFLDKLGHSSIVYYLNQGKMESRKVSDEEQTNDVIKELIGNGAQIVELKKDRSLEEAFIRWGLKGDSV